MTYQHLLLSSPAEGVSVVSFNRPEARNAINQAMQHEIAAVMSQLAADDSVRVVIITGEGDKAFSGGYDVREMGDWDDEQMLNANLRREPWIWQFANYPKPLIAAINGVAHGAGAIIAAAVDIRIGCSRTDIRFTATSYGGANNTWQLPLIVGWAKAKEFTLTARRIGADEAFQAGLLNHLVADDELLNKAIEIASEIAVHPPQAVRWTKQLIHEHVGRGYGDAYRAENMVMTTVLKPTRPEHIFKKFLSAHSKK